MPLALTGFLIFFGLLLIAVLALVAQTLWWKAKAERLVPPRGSFAQLSSGRLHYVDRGTGPVVLLVHGLGGQLGNFDMGLIDDLAQDYRVIAPDRPGMGYSARPAKAPAAPEDHAALMLELIGVLGLDRPLVVGHSLGGAIALSMALKAPEALRGLALLAPLTLPGQPPATAFGNLGIRSDLLRRVVAWTLATPGSLRNAPTVIEQIYGPEAMPPAAPVQGGALLGLRPGHFFNTSRDFLGSGRGLQSRANRYDQITLPLAVLFGRGDRILDPRLHGMALAEKVPGVRLELIEGGGHMIPVTRPALCAGFIRSADPERQEDPLVLT